MTDVKADGRESKRSMPRYGCRKITSMRSLPSLLRSALPMLAMFVVSLDPAVSSAQQSPMTGTPAPGVSPTVLLVAAGTAVPVHVVGSVSSGSAKEGDTFAIQVAEDVVVSGMIVFKRGAGGQGHIVESDSAGGNGHSGSLAMAFDYVYAADGGRVALSSAPQKQAEEDRKGASSTATIIGFATFGVGGLFGHNLAHGRQKTVDEKTVMSAFVDGNVHVQAFEAAVPVRYDR